MSDDQQALQDVLPAINAIALDEIQSSSMPIDSYIQEALDLYHAAKEDLARLQAVGFSEQWLQDLQQRTAALRAAQQNWVVRFQTRKDARSEWNRRSPEAYELRDSLLRNLRFALRRNAEAQTQCDFIARGTGHTDMLGDLNNLAGLGRRYSEALRAINFDLQQLVLAETTARELGTLLAEVNGDQLDGNEERVLRDRAYSYLKEAVNEIRDYGKFVFFDSPRIAGYQSEYHRSKNSRREPEQNNVEESPIESPVEESPVQANNA